MSGIEGLDKGGADEECGRRTGRHQRTRPSGVRSNAVSSRVGLPVLSTTERTAWTIPISTSAALCMLLLMPWHQSDGILPCVLKFCVLKFCVLSRRCTAAHRSSIFPPICSATRAVPPRRGGNCPRYVRGRTSPRPSPYSGDEGPVRENYVGGLSG